MGLLSCGYRCRHGADVIELYRYELWNGKEVVGHYSTATELKGNFLAVPEMSVFKQPYRSKTKHIEVPLAVRLIYKKGTDYTYRTFLDVRRKSKRQIELIAKAGW